MIEVVGFLVGCTLFVWAIRMQHERNLRLSEIDEDLLGIKQETRRLADAAEEANEQWTESTNAN